MEGKFHEETRSAPWLNTSRALAVSPAHRRPWWALVAICVGNFMIVADIAAITVALPSIKVNLGFSDTSLVWVINAYLVTYAGFLLVGGRLADIFGHRRLLLSGVLVFTGASLGCALPRTATELIIARSIQGVGGALLAAATLSLITRLFEAPKERARAIGVYIFACSSGGLLGVALAGVLTSLLSWRWIFLVNLPLGALAYMLSMALLPRDRPGDTQRIIDVPGAIAVTTFLLLAVYAVVDGDRVGWMSAQTLVLLGAATVALILFLLIEARAPAPLVPLTIFSHHNLLVCCVTNVLYSAAATSSAVLVSLYLQRILNYDPLEVGLAYLPWSGTTAIFALGLSAKLVIRFGIKRPLALGLVANVVAFLLFARAPEGGSLLTDALPAIILFGFSAGVVYNPILVAATNSVSAGEAGLVSGVINTASLIGRVLGLAVFIAVASAHANALSAAGVGSLTALNQGYHLAFLLGATCAACALAAAWRLLRTD